MMEENEILEDDLGKEEVETDGIAMELLHDLKEHNNRMDEHNKRLTSALKTAFITFAQQSSSSLQCFNLECYIS